MQIKRADRTIYSLHSCKITHDKLGNRMMQMNNLKKCNQKKHYLDSNEKCPLELLFTCIINNYMEGPGSTTRNNAAHPKQQEE